MKIEIQKPTPPVFEPRTLNITFENQAELDALTCLFNMAQIGQMVSGMLDTQGIWAKLYELGGHCHQTDTLREQLKKIL